MIGLASTSQQPSSTATALSTDQVLVGTPRGALRHLVYFSLAMLLAPSAIVPLYSPKSAGPPSPVHWQRNARNSKSHFSGT